MTIFKEKSKLKKVDFVDKILAAYPKKGSTAQAKKNIIKLLKTHTGRELLSCCIRYSDICKSENRDKIYITKPSNFFGNKSEFEEYLDCNYLDDFESIELYGKEKQEKEKIIQNKTDGFFDIPEKYRAAVSRVTLYYNNEDCEEPSDEDIKLANKWARKAERKKRESVSA